MKRIAVMSGAVAVLFAGIPGVKAQSSLNELAFNLDGNFYDNFSPFTGADDPSGDAGANTSGFNLTTGLGSIQFIFSNPGAVAVPHTLITFLDQDLAAGLANNNELGNPLNSPALGVSQRWEIDEPGYGNTGDPAGAKYFGDIWDHVSSSTLGGNLLDNSIGTSAPNDVSMALGYDFVVQPGETKTFNFNLTSTDPGSGFRLQQTDQADASQNIFFQSSVSSSTSGSSVPDTGTTLSTMVLAFAGLAAFNYKYRRA